MVEIWPWVICLLEEWAPPQKWGRVGTPEAVELAFHKIGDSLGELSAHVVAGTVGWMFLAALERVTKEREVVWREVAKQELRTVGCSKEGKNLSNIEIALLRAILVAQEGAENNAGCKKPWGRRRKGWCLQLQEWWMRHEKRRSQGRMRGRGPGQNYCLCHSQKH